MGASDPVPSARRPLSQRATGNIGNITSTHRQTRWNTLRACSALPTLNRRADTNGRVRSGARGVVYALVATGDQCLRVF